MISNSELYARKRLAIEMLLKSEGLTDHLQDNEAEILLDWGMAQAEAYALVTQETAKEEEARLAIDQGVTKVRRAMRFINNLLAERMDLSDGEMAEKLLHLISLAGELPRVQALAGEEEEEMLEEDID